MQSHPRDMNVARAILSALVLLAGSVVGVTLGDQATDPVVVAGGVGIIIAGALLGLTVLAARWRRGSRGYEATAMAGQRAARIEDIAAAFDATVPGIELTAEDSAAV